MKGAMYRIEETIQKILEGKKLLLAGDEAILKTLPKGNWIAGTIPYFIASDGGVTTKNEIFITELPDFIDEINILTYDADSLKAVYQDAYENGFSIMIIPGMSNIHLNFALNAQSYDSFASKPLAGWVSGLHLDDLGRQTAKVFNGAKKAFESDKAVVMHCRLPESFYAEIGIINIFKQGSGDTIVFKEDNFNQSNALVNGVEVDFADYIKNNNINTRLPLVANYLGAMINTGFQNVDASKSTVSFYAPVFKDVEYKLADQVQDYVAEFTSRLPIEEVESFIFSCNCILNYLYCKLEGRKTSNIVGPITFGEIAYMLLNQTMVYLSVKKTIITI